MAISGVTGAQSIMKSGVCTSTTRPASPYDGQVIYETDTDRAMVYNNTAWVVLSTGRANPSGLDLVLTQTIGTAVSSVTVSNAFSATYDVYKITVSGGASSSANQGLTLKLGASTTGYNMQLNYGAWANGASSAGSANQALYEFAGVADTNGLMANMELVNPFLAKYTFISSANASINIGGSGAGTHKVAASYTDFTLAVSAGTITGGTISVYGYAK